MAPVRLQAHDHNSGGTRVSVPQRTPSVKDKKTEPEVCIIPSDDAILAKAYRLYERDGCKPGHEVGNWIAASVHVKGTPPSKTSHSGGHSAAKRLPIREPHALGDEAGRDAHSLRMSGFGEP